MTQYYELGGKPRPVRFGYGAIMLYEKATGKSILQIAENMGSGALQLSEIIELIYAGYLNGCRAERIQSAHTREDVCDWLDEMPQATLQQITTQFANSFNGGKPAKPGSELAEEKN